MQANGARQALWRGLRLLSRAAVDVREAGTIQALDQEVATEFSVETKLAPKDEAPAPSG